VQQHVTLISLSKAMTSNLTWRGCASDVQDRLHMQWLDRRNAAFMLRQAQLGEDAMSGKTNQLITSHIFQSCVSLGLCLQPEVGTSKDKQG
jgi:hypothetical protein